MQNNSVTGASFIDIPGVRIAYEMAGQGSPLILLHGGLLDRRMWDGQFAFFARTHRLVRYDMRSSGQSETQPTTELFTHHEDLRQFLNAGLSNYNGGSGFRNCPS